MASQTSKPHRVWFGIGTKLISLIAFILVSSIVGLVWVSTRMFIENATSTIYKINADTAASLSGQMRELLVGVAGKMQLVGTVMVSEPKALGTDGTAPVVGSGVRDGLLQGFFEKDKDFLAIYVHHRDGAHPEKGVTLLDRAISPELAALNDPLGEMTLSALQAEKDFSLDQVLQNDIQIFTVTLPDGSVAVSISVPFIQSGDGFSHSLTSLIRHTRFSAAFSVSEQVTSFMVDRKGKLLAHSDASRVVAGESLGYLEIVNQLLSGKFNNGQTRYVDAQSKEVRLGAFRTVGFAGLGVVAEVPEAVAFELAHQVEQRSIFLGLAILCIAFLIGYLFSGSITWPIQQLALAAKKISEGDFQIRLKAKGRDEVAHLSRTFNDMAEGLEERDRVKATFSKFHNKEIADKLLSGEVKLGGERLVSTIFFSDVRGFTALSESMKPEEVVEMLNEYMTRMVSIIRAHGGIVDKYVGDAIMALWGVPLGREDDTYRAVRACIAMREELALLNDVRMARGQPALKIGMGLNRGEVIAGNIGSDEKMEYTVIGDSVNLASRVESMTKEYGTDLLISKNVYDHIKDRFVIENCKSAKVKGKSSAIEIFKVRGYVNEQGQEVIVETAYSSYASEKSDKGVHEAETVSDSGADGAAGSMAASAPAPAMTESLAVHGSTSFASDSSIALFPIGGDTTMTLELPPEMRSGALPVAEPTAVATPVAEPVSVTLEESSVKPSDKKAA